MEGQGKAKRAASLVGSVASMDSKGKPKAFPLWPEFNENDINAEKWEGATKGKEKGKSPSLQFFEDPEGRLEMPSSLAVDSWKRPQDFMLGKIPVVVENETEFDLLPCNEHIYHSQLMRSIITQMSTMWKMNNNNLPDSQTSSVDEDSIWRPWDHIYSMCKATKGHMPLHNPYGKYVVRLFWMGHWRKIVVDDQIPFDANDQILLPTTTLTHELWPMLLSKALIKIAAIDYPCNNDSSEVGDFFVVHALTGWVPEVVPVTESPSDNLWEFLKQILPQWTLPVTTSNIDENKTMSAVSKQGEATNAQNSSAHHKAEKGSGKESKTKEGSKKKDEKEKSKSGSHSGRPASAHSTARSTMDEESFVPKNPETVVFASFNCSCDSPASLTELRKMADVSQKLRKVGLSYLHSHAVFVKQSRSCPLVAPPPEVPVPQWKLIRPKKTFTTPHDEPKAKEKVPEPDQWLKISTPLLGHTIKPLAVDSAASRQHSASSTPLPEIHEKGKNIWFSESSLNNHELDPDSPVEEGEQVKHSNSNSPEDEETKGDVDKMSEGDNAEDIATKEPREESTWIHFLEFCQCFRNLIVFHKTSTYAHQHSVTEFKPAALNAGYATVGGGSSKKGSAQLNQALSSTNVLKAAALSSISPKAYEGYPVEDRVPSFLFVDSLKEIELVISYSVLPRWPGLEEKRNSDPELIVDGSDAQSVKQENQAIASGLLIAESYSWKTLIKGQPVMRIRTTGTKAACLTLPPGRHALQFTFNSPLGFHITVCSRTKFVYGDEETVMVPLQNESCRFVAVADQITTSIGKCIESFGNPERWEKARQELHNAHMPYKARNAAQLHEHYRIWRNALYKSFAAAAENKVLDLNFVFRCFTFHCEFNQPSENTKSPNEVPEGWMNKSASPQEEDAVTTIQKHWRATYVRKMKRAHDGSSDEHVSVRDTLNMIWGNMVPDIQAQGIALLRSMMDEGSDIVNNYPFSGDEWNRICLADYQGTFPDQPAKTWFIVFREVFHVESDVLCVPKLYIPSVPTCVLRVIDNDTGDEIKRVFQKVAPHVYKKNKRGYTFVAEARTLDLPLTTGKWRMKLIGARKPLPSPLSGQINSQFSVKEIRDYYIPNKLDILLRYHMEVMANHIGSIQLETSKPDVYIKLQILDNEEEILSVCGKGHCVIPAFYFITNYVEVTPEPPVSKAPQPSKIALTGAEKKRGGSAKSKDGKYSPKDGRKENELKLPMLQNNNMEQSLTKHNYTIQAVVEHTSWPLTETQLGFVQKLREQEKEELKAFSVPKDRPVSGGRGTDRQSGGGSKPAAEKSKKGGKGADKGGKKNPDKDSRPPSQNVYDGSQAFWALRFVSNQEQADDVVLKRDNQRQEEIRAMKLAWEAAEPGRAVKAMQSRLSYLSKLKPPEEPAPAENPPEVADDEEPVEVEPPKPYRSPIVDIASFYRPKEESLMRKYFDKFELERKQNSKLSEQINVHQEARKRSLMFREENRNFRLKSKEHQIDVCFEMQEQLDKNRASLIQPREDFRQQLLDEKRAKEEEQLAAAALSLPPSPDPKTRKSAGKKK